MPVLITAIILLIVILWGAYLAAKDSNSKRCCSDTDLMDMVFPPDKKEEINITITITKEKD